MGLEEQLDDLQNIYNKPICISGKEMLSTGFEEINTVIGGGYNKGTITEIFGRESSAKTYLVLKAIKEVQNVKGITVFVDTDYTFDFAYFKTFNIDKKSVHVLHPENGEELNEKLEYIVRSGGIDLLIIDSIASILPKEGDGDAIEHIKHINKFVKKISATIGTYGCYCLFTNQIRENGTKNGISTGGGVLKFYASLRINTERTYKLKKDKNNNIIGESISVKIIKNKFAQIEDGQYKKTKIEILYT